MSDDFLLEPDQVVPDSADAVEEIVPDVVSVAPAPASDPIANDDERVPPPPESDLAHPDETMNRVLQTLDALGETLNRKLDRLEARFDREVRAEANREKVVDRLHAELQEYKQDLLLNVMRPVFIDLIQLHDDIGKIIESQNDGSDGVQRSLEHMRGFQQGLEDILYRQGVEPFLNETDTFDPRRQRAVATVATDDAGVNKTIAARHRKGFRAGEKVIRPEIVSVFALKK